MALEIGFAEMERVGAARRAVIFTESRRTQAFVREFLEANGYAGFVDPKGLRNLEGPEDPKIAFYQRIKDLEADLRAQDPSVTLNSFIISNTRFKPISWWDGGMSKADLEARHVLFQQEDRETYIGKLLQMTLVS